MPREYGRAAGGVVNIITRSGSNDFHGDVFGYLRNRNFQAVNPFSTTSNPAYTRVQAGTAFGGAIKKDKTFYYFSYEVTRRHETGFSSGGSSQPGHMRGSGHWVGRLRPVQLMFPRPSAFRRVRDLDILATPQQVAFLGATPPPELAPYAVVVGAASGIAVNGAYPASFGAWLASAGGLPIPTNGSNPLAQFFSSLQSPGTRFATACRQDSWDCRRPMATPETSRFSKAPVSTRCVWITILQQQSPDVARECQPQHGDRH